MKIMKFENLYCLLAAVLIGIFTGTHNVNAQDITEVEAKGYGIERNDALQDALRNAIGQAAGVSISSETNVENFIVVKDAVATRTQGYINSYNIINEAKLSQGYEITVNAKVALSVLKADMKLLAKQIGGVRFLVMYDKRKTDPEDRELYDLAIDRINGFLAKNQYRYIEKERFERLQEEALKIMESTDTSSMSFMQKLGLISGAQFIILVDNIIKNEKSEAFETRKSNQVILTAKAYDNCTAEGLGIISLKSDWSNSVIGSSGMHTATEQAIDNNFDELINLFHAYIGEWVNNGIPFELRFYHTGTLRDFRDLRNKIKESPDFGGQLEITSVNDYTRLNLTMKSLPDDLAFDIMDMADAVPNMKDKKLNVLLIYGRQISFAPDKVVVPEIEKEKAKMDDIN